MPDETASEPGDEAVLLIHGLAGVPIVMLPLARSLRKAGYKVVQWNYPSTRRTVVSHAEKILPVMRQMDAEANIRRVNLVTHSMGGIVARVALQKQPFNKPGRFVMISPPNQGTPLASRFASYFGWLMRPLTELTHHPTSFVNALQPPQGMDTGVIAARNDLIVPLACTHLSGQCDHIVLRGRHTDILFRRETIKQVLAFLESGHFLRSSS